MSENQRTPPRCITGQSLRVSEAEFHERLVKFFRPFLSTSPVDWACVQKSITYFTPFLKFRDLLDLYFDYIFGLFEDFRITDRAVTLAFVKKYCRFKMYYCGFRYANNDEFHFPMGVRQEHMVELYEYYRTPVYLQQLLSRPFFYRDLSMVKRILRYVAPVIIEWDDLPDYVSCIKYKIFWQDPFMEHVDCYQWDQREDAGGRRLKLILMAMDFLLKMRIENNLDCIKGYSLLFQAIPDPYITCLEIFRFLDRCITLWPSERKDMYTKSFMKSCTDCFPESRQVLRPRSLKHLARCEVRRCLGSAHTLPHGVWGLQLPRELEDYVLLQTHKTQFRPVIRPLSWDRVFILGPVTEIQSQESLGLGRS